MGGVSVGADRVLQLLRLLRAVSRDARFSVGQLIAVSVRGDSVVHGNSPRVGPCPCSSGALEDSYFDRDRVGRGGDRVVHLWDLRRGTLVAGVHWCAARRTESSGVYVVRFEWTASFVESVDVGTDRRQSAERCVARVLSRLVVTFVQLRVAEY